MRTNILRTVAVTLGIGVCTIAQAQSPYTAPAKWNNFRPVRNYQAVNNFRQVSDKGETALKAAANQAAEKAVKPVAELPAPVPAPTPEPIEDPTPRLQSSTMSHQPVPAPAMSAAPADVGCPSCGTTTLNQAISAPWGGSARPPLANWFGSANLLFFTLEDGSGRYVSSGLGSDFTTSLVRPRSSVGFDVSAGRYLDCGRWGLGMTYMLWNPGLETVTRLGTAGTIRASSPGYRDITYASAANPDIYAEIDALAAGVRVTRDLRFQGIEANLFSFGLMGGQRAAYMGSNCCGLMGSRFGTRLGLGNRCVGYGGATGPLVRPCGGRVRIMTSHGFRWFQAKDELELAYNIDGTAGYGAADLYENVDVENNLFGYQFGGRLTYCLTSRMNLNIGGKFGIYGNHAEMRHRVGTLTEAAYRTGVPGDVINTKSTDTSLATLGELDLGLGYRLSCAWSIRGGYRLIGLTGVANAVDSLPTNYYSVAASGQVHADDSYLLHGGYVGLEFNW